MELFSLLLRSYLTGRYLMNKRALKNGQQIVFYTNVEGQRMKMKIVCDIAVACILSRVKR